jgi:nucleotide-binding universal stress UspA family protein
VSWKTIVVAYDGSGPAAWALERAAELAGASGARLVVTSVARPLPSGAAAHGLGPFDPADPPEAHEQLLQQARELLADRGFDAELEVAVGDVAGAIIDVADRHEADLIVVGTREPGFLDRLVGGSTSQAVSRHAHCDVFIVHSPEGADG